MAVSVSGHGWSPWTLSAGAKCIPRLALVGAIAPIPPVAADVCPNKFGLPCLLPAFDSDTATWVNPSVRPSMGYRHQMARRGSDSTRRVQPEVLQFGALLTLMGSGRVIPKRGSGFRCMAKVTEVV